MILYIYDSYLTKFTKKITNLEIELHKLNLNGKIVYLENIKNLDSIIKDEINNGVKSIIAVGNNLTLNKALNAIVNSSKDSLPSIALGMIPISDNNSIAEALGIKNEKEAAEIILARRIEKINIAKANNHYYISEANINTNDTSIKIDNFSISPLKRGQIRIINLKIEECSARNILISPNDGILNLVIDNKAKNPSVLSVKTLDITNNANYKLIIDGCLEIESPIQISMSGLNINIMVGKNRDF